MKRIFVWGTVVAGSLAAYLMLRRGEKLGTVAARVVSNPVGSFADEVKQAF